jgi:hypothetical protein
LTFTELVTEAANRLNLSSTDATTRLGSYINQRYRRLTSSIGLNTSRRGTAPSVNTVAGTETVSFALEKIEVVYVLASGSRRVLDEVSYDQLRIRNTELNPSGTPTEYAIKTSGVSSVTVALSPVPSAIITLYADGLLNASTLSGTNIPDFPADYHDALILGAISDELFKMEKYALAKDFQKQYEDRVADLQMFLAKSAYLSMTQGDSSRDMISFRRRWGV